MDQEVHVDELSRLSAVRADSCLSIPATITTAVVSASISKPDPATGVPTSPIAPIATTTPTLSTRAIATRSVAARKPRAGRTRAVSIRSR